MQSFFLPAIQQIVPFMSTLGSAKVKINNAEYDLSNTEKVCIKKKKLLGGL